MREIKFILSYIFIIIISIIGLVVAENDFYNLGALGLVISFACIISLFILIGKKVLFKEQGFK